MKRLCTLKKINQIKKIFTQKKTYLEKRIFFYALPVVVFFNQNEMGERKSDEDYGYVGLKYKLKRSKIVLKRGRPFFYNFFLFSCLL